MRSVSENIFAVVVGGIVVGLFLFIFFGIGASNEIVIVNNGTYEELQENTIIDDIKILELRTTKSIYDINSNITAMFTIHNIPNNSFSYELKLIYDNRMFWLWNGTQDGVDFYAKFIWNDLWYNNLNETGKWKLYLVVNDTTNNMLEKIYEFEVIE